MTEQEDWADLMSSDLERTTAQDLRDAVALRLPHPNEHHNASGIPISDRSLACLLIWARVGEALAPCAIDDCENCNEFHLIWWDGCNALDKSTRISLQAWLNAGGWGLPEAPWEDVAPDGTPYPRGYVGPHA